MTSYKDDEDKKLNVEPDEEPDEKMILVQD